jgi:hypothetical protein
MDGERRDPRHPLAINGMVLGTGALADPFVQSHVNGVAGGLPIAFWSRASNSLSMFVRRPAPD